MTGPLAQQFARLWERLNWICSDSLDLPLTLGDGGTALDAQTPEMGEVSAWFAESRAALSAIERHVQDMERETRCEKCGTDDVLVRWHERRPSNRQAACRDDMSVLDYGKRPEEKKEHLHYHCRRCQFDWTAPVRAALPAREKEEETNG